MSGTVKRLGVIAIPLLLLGAGGLTVGLARLGRGTGAPRSPGASPAARVPSTWFEDGAPRNGVAFRLAPDKKEPLTILGIMGTGCAACDLDGDGHADLFLVGQNGASPGGRCALYRNRGNGTFQDVTAGSGLEAPGMYMGCAVGDVDNDGRPDVLVTGYGVNRLYRNRGGMKFADVSKGSGLEAPSPVSWASSAAFFDFDRDGLLDVYIGRYVQFDKHAIQLCNYAGVKAACGPLFYDPQRGSLYRNLGAGRFKDVTQQCGLDSGHGKCLGVAVADTNGDGWPDFYLANDELPGDLLVNRGGKRFDNSGAEAGVALSAEGEMNGGMGVDFGDYDRCGRQDLWVSTYQDQADGLYQCVAPGLFRHVSLLAGITRYKGLMVTFGAKYADFDNDGWLDIAMTHGHIRDKQELVDRNTQYRQPMLLLMNQNGQTFANRTEDAGPGFTAPAVGRGLAVADLDDDGRMDVVAMDLEGPVRVLMNRCPAQGRWIRIALVGRRRNRMGIGARVTVVAGQDRWVSECTSAGSYMSASDERLHFGLGSHQAVDRVEVRWPDGVRSVTRSPGMNKDVVIREP